MNPPRTGRPPKDDPKHGQYRIRLSESDQEKLDYCSEVTGMPKAEIIRDGIERIYQELREQEQTN